MGLFLAWRRLGGWPEAWYRIGRIDYFSHHMFDASRKESRHVHRMDLIEVKSPAMFPCGKGRFHANEDARGMDTGRPAWWYNEGEMEPIPMFTWKQSRPGLNPSLVQSAWEDKALEDFHRIGTAFNWKPWLLIGGGIVLVMIVSMVSLYYAHDASCSLHPAACSGGGFHP